MGIRPKFSFGRQGRMFVAAKEFTDREEPKAAFDKNLETLAANIRQGISTHQVLTYYGVGGIGKTALRQRLRERALSKVNTAVMELDFQNIHSRECAAGLLELGNSFESNIPGSKLSLHHFHLAYSIYLKKRNPDSKSDDYNLFEKAGIFMDIIKFLDPIGVVGISQKVVNSIYNMSRSIVFDKDIKPQFLTFSQLTLKEMEERLPAFFAYDLNRHLDSGPGTKLVVFFDTFEALSSIADHELKKLQKQEWIQELIGNLPNVLFTIFGRQKLSWGPAWEEYLEQHILSELATVYSSQFLERCGIEEESIRNKIAEVSKGHPYYLDLSVDTYFAIKNRGEVPQLEDFGNGEEEILRRFIQNLTDVQIETLRLMSVPNYYNLELFQLLVKEFNVPYSVTQFGSFNNYSFVSENRVLGTFTIHLLMREGIQKSLRTDVKKEIHRTLHEYYERRYVLDKRENVFENIYHKLYCSGREEFFTWLIDTKLEYLLRLQVYGDTVILTHVCDEILKVYGVNEWPPALFNVYEDMVHLAGNYQASVRIAEEYLARFSSEEVYGDKDLVRLKFRIVHHKMFFVNADVLFAELEEIESRLDPEAFFTEHCEVLYMMGGGIGFLTGHLERCMTYLDRLRRRIDALPAKTGALENIYLRAIRKTIDYYRVQGDFLRADALCRRYLDSSDSAKTRYQIYLLCSYGEILRGTGDHGGARQCFEKVSSITKVLGIRGWTAHAYLGLANVELDEGDFTAAFGSVEKALEIYEDLEHEWGKVNSQILLGRISLTGGGQEVEANKALALAKEAGERMGYRYELSLIESILADGQIGEQQLLFV